MGVLEKSVGLGLVLCLVNPFNTASANRDLDEFIPNVAEISNLEYNIPEQSISVDDNNDYNYKSSSGLTRRYTPEGIHIMMYRPNLYKIPVDFSSITNEGYKITSINIRW
jgi:hypothetical protein